MRARNAVMLVGALSVAGLLAGPAAGPASADPVWETKVEQPFEADSGDACRYGHTRGLLGWHLDPPTRVDVEGTGQVEFRDSKDPAGPVLSIHLEDHLGFVNALKVGHFDRT
jgi:hypothetical protein